ncbi:MAG: hypothetical protein ABIR18_02445 [Chitinophagaceae bacterium]
MNSIITIPSRLIEYQATFKVDVKEKPLSKTRAKYKTVYPRIVMPEQPQGYIKPRKNDCW